MKHYNGYISLVLYGMCVVLIVFFPPTQWPKYSYDVPAVSQTEWNDTKLPEVCGHPKLNINVPL